MRDIQRSLAGRILRARISTLLEQQAKYARIPGMGSTMENGVAIGGGEIWIKAIANHGKRHCFSRRLVRTLQSYVGRSHILALWITQSEIGTVTNSIINSGGLPAERSHVQERISGGIGDQHQSGSLAEYFIEPFKFKSGGGFVDI